MKNDIKKYLTLGAALAGSVFMVSCDGGDDVTVVNDSGVAGAITDAIGNKPIAPIAIAKFPVTSLKLAFESTAGTCIGAAFSAGEEFEIDFDSTTVTSNTATTGNAQGDGNEDSDDTFYYGDDVFVEGITAVTTAPTWTIAFVKNGTSSAGSVLLSNLTFTPLASDQRSVTGRFTATAPVDVNFNQDASNVVGSDDGSVSENLNLPNGGSSTINSVAVYENVTGNAVEVIAVTGSPQFDTTIGDSNYGLSFGSSRNGCVYNFVLNKAAVVAAVTGGLAQITNGITDAEAAQILALVNFNAQLDVSPAGNQIAASEASPRYLTAGSSSTGVSGSYRHDYDSSTGNTESEVQSSDGSSKN